MTTDSAVKWLDYFQARLCYQMFITPLPVYLPAEYRELAHKGCEYLEEQRTRVIHKQFPRHHVLHHFKNKQKTNGKKILITHGWVSRAAYMVRFIRALSLQGFEVYALDFPAHGDAKGAQLPWPDAIRIIQQTLNQYGPFHGALGHSFGGSMLLCMLNLSGQLPEFKLHSPLERIVLIASPTHMQTPMFRLAKFLKLSPQGYKCFSKLIHDQADIDPERLRLNRFLAQKQKTPILCIHGTLDNTVPPRESTIFCQKYKQSQLVLLPNADHINVLYDERAEQMVCEFMLEDRTTEKDLLGLHRLS